MFAAFTLFLFLTAQELPQNKEHVGANFDLFQKQHVGRETLARACASMPAPALTKSLVASADSGGNVPVVGYSDAIELTGTDDEGTDYDISTDEDGDGYVDGYYVVASSADLESTSASLGNAPQPPLNLRGGESPNGARGSYDFALASILPQFDTQDLNWNYSAFPSPPVGEGQGEGSNVFDLFIANAYATTLSTETTTANYCEGFDPTDTTPYTNTDASGNTYTCCAITTSGSYECFIPSADNTITAHVYVTDTDTLGDATTDTVNTSFLYLRQAPTDVKGGAIGQSFPELELDDAGVFFNLAGSSVVPIAHQDGVFKVVGDPSENYEAVSTTATQLAFDPTGLNFAGRVSGEGIPYASFNPSYLGDPLNDIFSSWGEASSDDASSYTALKVTGSGATAKIRFGIQPISKLGKIYDMEDPTDISRTLIFLESGDITGVENNQTLFFDVEDDSSTFDIGLALFEDGTNAMRLRAVNPDDASFGRFGGDTVLTSGDGYTFSASGFGDLQIYKNEAFDSVSGNYDHGRALLLDKTNSKVWVIAYHYDDLSPSTASTVGNVADGSSTLTVATDGISIGSSPKSLVLNDDKTKAYVLCGDDKIYVLDLFSSGTPYDAPSVPVTTISLSDYWDKDVTLSPNQLSYQKDSSDNEYLLVSVSGTKGNVVIDLGTASYATAQASTATLRLAQNTKSAGVLPVFGLMVAPFRKRNLKNKSSDGKEKKMAAKHAQNIIHDEQGHKKLKTTKKTKCQDHKENKMPRQGKHRDCVG